MRTLVLVLTILCFVAASAYAQTTRRVEPRPEPRIPPVERPDDGRFEPEWERRPTGPDFARNYPSDALDRAVPARVELCCTPREDRTLDCSSGFAWPTTYPFDRAAVAISRSFRMTPKSYAAFQATPGAWLQIPITFRHTSTGGEFDRVSNEIAVRSLGLCRLQPQAPAPAP